MKIIKDEKVIKRNARIGQVLSIVAMAVLGVGIYITFARQDLFNLSILALMVGFLLSQLGIHYTNSWGRRPRPDESLDKALKGLDSRYSLYHYVLPGTHVLVGPAGVWTLFPKRQGGTITYSKNRWRQKTKGVLSAYLKIFAQEGLGRPDLEIQSETEALARFLKKKFPELETPPIQAAMVFFHPDVDLQVEEDAPVQALPGAKLKDFIRKTAKEKPISLDAVSTIQDFLGE
jgi:hypothetical protein